MSTTIPRQPTPTGATCAGRSTSSATCTAAPTSWSSCCTSSAIRCGSKARATSAAPSRPHPPGAARSSSATSSTADRTRPTSCASSWTWPRAGQALCVPGNHDDKLLRWLKGREVKIGHGLERTIEQLDGARRRVQGAHRARSSRACPYHAWLDGGALAIAHAGVRENMLGRNSPKVRSFCLYGDTSGGRTRTDCPSASTGRPTIAARRRSFTGTRRSPSRNGSTIRCASTPAACSAAS